jgi:signal transduction histidine kinase/DNA-binding response OmpR family regulator
MRTVATQLATSARILVVDDEVELMTVLCEMLAEHGYETVGCASAEEALAVLHEQEVDLLITDLMMPGMDGITLLRLAQEAHPYLLGIVATGQGTIQTAVDAMKTGAFDYVLKPFKLSALLPTLERAIDVGRLKRDNVQLRETVAIYELSQAVALSLDPAVILRKVADAALEQCEAEAVSVMLSTPSGDALEVAAVGGSSPPELVGTRVPLQGDIAAWVASQQEPRARGGASDAPPFDRPGHGSGPASAFSAPMLAGGRLVGVLNVWVEPSRLPLTSGRRKALAILTSTAAAALESAFLAEQKQAEERARLVALERAARAEAEAERAARVAAEQAVAIRDEFLSVAAHELKTPITSLLGAVQLLMRQREKEIALAPGQIQRSMQIVDRQAARMSRLVTQLLESSRLDGGQFSPQRSLVNVTSVVTAAVEQAQGATDRHEIVLSAPASIPAHVDALRIEQVVGNLLDNAIKFSPDGGRIEVELSTPRAETIRVAVRDHGLGIPPPRRRELFTRYYQAHAESHRSGLGLGLYISRRIVEHHGGKIRVEFPADVGSRFIIDLPAGANGVGAALARQRRQGTA